MADGFRLDFVGVGPQRTATSWLDAVLRPHPGIALPRGVKETMFFDLHHANGLPWYLAHFRGVEAGKVRGEIGPSYFDVPEAVERIRAFSPGCRIIISLRDPAERTFSLYLHHLAKGRVTGTLREAAEQMPRILSSGHYAEHIGRWVDAFGAERVTYVLQEEVEARPAEVLDRLYGFLGVERVAPPALASERVGGITLPRFPALARTAARTATYLRGRRMHGVVELGKRLGFRKVYTGGEGKPRLSPEDRAWLVDLYRDDVRFVERVLGRDLSAWRGEGGAR